MIPYTVESFDNMVRLVGGTYEGGIPVEVGTDGTAGFTLMRELELDVKAGIPASAAPYITAYIYKPANQMPAVKCSSAGCKVFSKLQVRGSR